ncbi:hypothetical protein FK268_12535 [Tsukamurella sputi]|uniref:PE-PPE domain-containing protein n=1 Tax=Tsukamurella sputi TaxID=2591848 RepID=A0A5C5RP10_9ACTN|nr:hypothetical protein [Tsukamurella sputi]TWS24410.1 hypothetical protein FK268_12535 [Tsukamurella sputi]
MAATHAAIYMVGTNEPFPADARRPLGMMSGVADELDRLAPGRFEHWTPRYLAQYANPNSYGESRVDGVIRAQATIAMVRSRGLIPFVVGFSQGAAVANLATDESPYVPCGYLLADPLRPAGANRTGQVGDRGWQAQPDQHEFRGFGVGGEHRVGQARWYSIPGDVITDCTPGSLVRDFADISEWFSIAGPEGVRTWAAETLDKVKSGAWQNLPFWTRLFGRRDLVATLPQLPQIAATSIAEATGYPSIHTAYGARNFPGTTYTYVQQMARDMFHDSAYGSGVL